MSMDNTLDSNTLKPSLALARDWVAAVAGGGEVRPAGDKPFSASSPAHGRLPFSFQYGGRLSSELVPGWKKASRASKTRAGVTTRELTWRDPATGLECLLEMRTFAKTPAVEWTMRLRNTGKQDTPLLRDLRSLDLDLSPPAEGVKATIRAVRGCGHGDQPFALDPIVPERGTTWRTGNPFAAKTWKHHLPFLNLELGVRGLFCGLGWPGRWMLAVTHRDDFGNPEARQAMTEHMARLIAENGIDVFRQDCNVALASRLVFYRQGAKA